MWHRIYVWEACTYFFQALSAQIFMLMPIWYCFTWEPPFTTYKTEFIAYLIPYFLTAILPTMIGLGWRKVNPDLVSLPPSRLTSHRPLQSPFPRQESYASVLTRLSYSVLCCPIGSA